MVKGTYMGMGRQRGLGAASQLAGLRSTNEAIDLRAGVFHGGLALARWTSSGSGKLSVGLEIAAGGGVSPAD